MKVLMYGTGNRLGDFPKQIILNKFRIIGGGGVSALQGALREVTKVSASCRIGVKSKMCLYCFDRY